MGLIHSRAAKKRNKAEAELLREQTRQLREAAAEDQPAWRQPTIGGAISKALKNRQQRGAPDTPADDHP
jgi:hypothetical protein